MQSNRIDTLDWMRALAVAAVVAGHAYGFIARGGAVGVSVFFVLSGFLIASILLRDGMMTIQNIAVFMLRRIVRIYPLYTLHICAVGAFLAFSDPASFHVFREAAWAMLTFSGLPGEWIGYSTGVLWTLYVEFWFYVSFPLVLMALSLLPGSPLRNISAGFVFLGGLCLVYKATGGTDAAWVYYDHFLIGAAAAAAIAFKKIPAIFYDRSSYIFGVFLIVAMVWKEYPGDRNLEWHIQSLVAAIGTAAFILGTTANPPRIRLPIVACVGRISYSVYLVHSLVLDIFISFANRPMKFSEFVVYTAVVLAISDWTYRRIEIPIIERAHRLLRFRTAKKPA